MRAIPPFYRDGDFWLPAVEDLELERLWVVYPGKAACPLTEKIQAIPLANVSDTWNYG